MERIPFMAAIAGRQDRTTGRPSRYERCGKRRHPQTTRVTPASAFLPGVSRIPAEPC